MQDRTGRTALHYAAMKSNNAILKMLLEAGADAGIADGRGKKATDSSIDKGGALAEEMRKLAG